MSSKCVTCLLDAVNDYADYIKELRDDRAIEAAEHIYEDLLEHLRINHANLDSILEVMRLCEHREELIKAPLTVYDDRAAYLSLIYGELTIEYNYTKLRLDSIANLNNHFDANFDEYLKEKDARISSLYKVSMRKKLSVFALSIMGIMGWVSSIVGLTIFADTNPILSFLNHWTVTSLFSLVMGSCVSLAIMYILRDDVRCASHRQNMTLRDSVLLFSSGVKTLYSKIKE